MGKAPIVPPPAKVTSRRHARRLTSQYHDITRRLAASVSEQDRSACHAELEAMGGVKAYQQASALNTALNSTSRWVTRAIRRWLPASSGQSASPTRVLEIGAVNTQLLDTPGLTVRAIDLHALEPRIEQCDFLTLGHGGALGDARTPRLYDVVVCSMVLNCVPNERHRFDMLVGMRAQLRLGGRAFVTLPRSCVEHSFTVNEASFRDALAAVGLPCLADSAAAGVPPSSAKIVYFECEAQLPNTEAALRFQRVRHEAREASRAARKPKSAGAAFDIDLGGCLGFGIRIPRSFVRQPARAEREQAVARVAFLRQCALADGSGEPARAQGDPRERCASEPAAEHHDAVVDDLDDDLGGLAETRRTIDAAVEAEASKEGLDFSRWRWHDARATRGQPAWQLATAARPSAGISAQDTSGWHWSPTGWVQQAPQPARPARESAADRLRQSGGECSARHGVAAGSGVVKRDARTRRRPHHDPGTRPLALLPAWSTRACWWQRILSY